MRQVFNFLRRLRLTILGTKNPFASFIVLSEDPYGQMEVKFENGVSITIFCSKSQVVSARDWLIPKASKQDVFKLYSQCSDDSPDVIKKACELIIIYPQLHPLLIRKSDVFDILSNHYLKSLEFQLPRL